MFYNTAFPDNKVDFQTAVFQGLADGSGLFMPENFSPLEPDFWSQIHDREVWEIAFPLLNAVLGNEIPADVLKKICQEAFSFPVPLVALGPRLHTLELFHGPSLAFKDFGARFMARIMAWYNLKRNKPLHILVATSGDTGGAVAMGFHQVPHTRVTILFPKGRVSAYQEWQLTRLGGNIKALEVEGSFDDCQALVKEAFMDRELSASEGLTSANSINIARLLPQMVYYAVAWAALSKKSETGKVVFSVPSGNFGNICAAAFAWQLGLPVERLVAATNANRVFTDFLTSGAYEPKPSVATLSNAMDVGNPSNFVRIKALYQNWEGIQAHFSSYSFSDEETQQALFELYEKYGYLSEPHGAVAYLGARAYQKETRSASPLVFLGTAHPAKFLPVIPKELAQKIAVPAQLLTLQDKPAFKTTISNNFSELKKHLIAR